MRFVCVVGLACLLAGCAAERYEHLETTYKISDDPDDGRITITPTMGGRLFSRRGGSPEREQATRQAYRSAVERYIAESGRVCVITDERQRRLGRWDFQYSCPPGGLPAN